MARKFKIIAAKTLSIFGLLGKIRSFKTEETHEYLNIYRVTWGLQLYARKRRSFLIPDIAANIETNLDSRDPKKAAANYQDCCRYEKLFAFWNFKDDRSLPYVFFEEKKEKKVCSKYPS